MKRGTDLFVMTHEFNVGVIKYLLKSYCVVKLQNTLISGAADKVTSPTLEKKNQKQVPLKEI